MCRVQDREAMIAGMSPRLVEGTFRFVTVTDESEVTRLLAMAQAMFKEDEGVSLIVAADANDKLAMSQITLDVHSALDGVGLTAAVSGALADAAIPCNVVAANHHDHLFVPVHQAAEALGILEALAAG